MRPLFCGRDENIENVALHCHVRGSGCIAGPSTGRRRCALQMRGQKCLKQRRRCFRALQCRQMAARLDQVEVRIRQPGGKLTPDRWGHQCVVGARCNERWHGQFAKPRAQIVAAGKGARLRRAGVAANAPGHHAKHGGALGVNRAHHESREHVDECFRGGSEGVGELRAARFLRARIASHHEFQPAPPLLPHGLHARARVRSLAAMIAADTHPLITPRVKKYLVSTSGFDDAAWRAWQVQWFGTGLAALEQRLASEAGTGTFCHGDAPTMADICLASIVVMLRIFKITIPDIPTIDRIMVACNAHPAFANAAPHRQAGAPPL